MRITYIFRNPTSGQYSIERVFDPVIRNLSKDHEVERIYLPHRSTGLLNILRNILFLKNLKAADIYHVTGDVNYAVLGLPTNKTILTIHDIDSILSGNLISKYIKRLIFFILPFRSAKMITCISDFTRKQIIDNFNVNADKLVTVHNPIKGEFKFLPRTKLQDPLQLLQIGTKKNKNLERLIVALEGIPCQLNIVGKLNESQRNLLKDHKILFENIYDISDEEIKELIDRTDILMFLSTYEGFGMPVIEAQATGRPVLASDIPSIREIGGDAAEFVDPLDLSEIRKGLETLITSESRREELIKLGKENISRFSTGQISQDYLKHYMNLADR